MSLLMVMATPDQVIHLLEPAVGCDELQGQRRSRGEAKSHRILSKNPGGAALEMDVSSGEEGGNELTRNGIFVSERQDRRLARDQGDEMSARLLPLEERVPSVSDNDLDLGI